MAYKINALLLSSLFFISGCAPQADLVTTSEQMNLTTGIEHQGKVSNDLTRDSKAFHSYLVGELSYLSQDTEEALSELEKAAALVSDPAPLLHYRLAELYVRNRDLVKGEVQAQLAYEQDQNNIQALLLYAGILAEEGKDLLAQEMYLKVKDRIDATLLTSSLMLRRNELTQSQALLKQFVSKNPKEPLGYLFLGRTTELLGQKSAAETLFKKAQTLSGEKQVAFVDLVRVLLSQSKFEEAKKLCSLRAEKNPEDQLSKKLLLLFDMPRAFQETASAELEAVEKRADDPTITRFRVALYQIEKQEFFDAVRELTLVLAKDPNNYDARYYLASIYAGSGRRKESVVELFKIPKESPLFVKSRTFAAFILRQDSNLEQARQAVEDALKVEPTNQSLILYLVLILRDAGEYSEAKNLLRNALKENPRDEKLIFNLALVFHDLKRDDDALQKMEEVLTIDPAHVDALNYVAYSLSDKEKDLPRAESLIKKALEMRPNDGFFLDTLGWVYFKQGKGKEAEDMLSKALAATGDDIVIVEHYIEILIGNGKKEIAVAILKGIIHKNSDERELPHEKRAVLARMRERLDKLIGEEPGLQSVKQKAIPGLEG